MNQKGMARLYDETNHFRFVRVIYEDERDKALFIMRKDDHVNFWRIPERWKIEYTTLF